MIFFFIWSPGCFGTWTLDCWPGVKFVRYPLKTNGSEMKTNIKPTSSQQIAHTLMRNIIRVYDELFNWERMSVGAGEAEGEPEAELGPRTK